MIVSIHQPNYIPWLGFLNKMALSDTFVLLDNVQHSKSSFTNRNRIKTATGEVMLTVPLKNKEKLINALVIDNPAKNLLKHWRIIENNYSKARYWGDFADVFYKIYSAQYNLLVDLNVDIIRAMANIFDLKCNIVIASDLGDITGTGNERNISICKALHATSYLSGNGAKIYNDETQFEAAGIQLIYNNFICRPYRQLWGSFIPNLSAIDFLFNEGPENVAYLTQFTNENIFF